MKIKLLLFCGLVGFFFLTEATAQKIKVTTETESFTDYELVNDDHAVLPPHQMLVPVVNGQPAIKILEQNTSNSYRMLDEETQKALLISSDSVSVVQLLPSGIFKNQEYVPVLIHRARHSDIGTIVTTKLRFRVYKRNSALIKSKTSTNIFTDSPLASGIWYKIPISGNQIYQLNSAYLSSLGINISSIDPRNIQLWGTDGYQLPELNSAARPAFSQIPIIVEGESDGSFDVQDRIIFYGNSPHRTFRNGQIFQHSVHPYSDLNYIFLTVGSQNGMRLSSANTGLNPTATVTTFTDFIWKDDELVKPEDRFKSGRFWLGQQIPSSQSNSIISVLKDTLPNLGSNVEVFVSGRMYARSEALTTFDINLNGTDVANQTMGSLSSTSSSRGYNGNEGPAAVAYNFTNTVTVSPDNNTFDLTARVTHRQQNSVAFVDWLRLTFNRSLSAENERLFFYTENDNDPVTEVTFRLQNFSSAPYVLDVTNPVSPIRLQVSSNSSDFNLDYFQNDGRQIIAQTNLVAPNAGTQIPNQNLRGINEYPEYVVVASEALLDPARELVNYRESQGLSSVLVTQDQILNEFSGGVKDPTAIRDYLKFLYDRAIADGENPPSYLLLFGDTSYDTKNIVPNALINHVLTYQSTQSTVRATGGGGGSFGTDDYFGYMDESEGDFGGGNTSASFLIDIGVGRIIAQTRTEGFNFVEKIKRYENDANAGDWQNLFTFAADDDFPEPLRNRDLHTINADVSAEMMNVNEPGIRIKKIYAFSYPEEITGAGRQIPEATNDFISSVNNGTLVLNYSGHGNEQTLSDEELFLSQYITNFTNKSRLCVLVTATCQFGRYDDTSDQSGAERFVTASNGGAIAAFTTTRVVYTSSNISANNNFGLNIALSQRMAERNADGSPKRLGDIMRETKNSLVGSSSSPIGSSTNNKKFVLLGDPATIFKLPSRKAVISSINGVEVLNKDTTLTIRALDQITITGRIENAAGNIDNAFSGETTISVFDAKRSVSLPERDWTCVLNGNCTYTVESDLLFKGKASVQNGAFNQIFVVPKDIGNSDENGRIVLYTNGDNEYAGGTFTGITFNGVNPSAVNDGSGPSLNVFLNDEKFVNGNLVSDSPTLIVELQDNSGINTTGTGVGHEIIATIDTKPQQTFILNEFYEGNLNDFTGGRIEFPLDQLPEGSYTLKVRAWDVHNNPNEEEIFFEVAPQNELLIRSVYNYPNPMNNKTQFSFEHNQPGNPLDVSIKIYTLSGKPVQHIKQESLITSSSYANIPWNGRDRDNDRLGNGTYIYVLRVATDTPEGRQSIEKIEKLVIIR